MYVYKCLEQVNLDVQWENTIFSCKSLKNGFKDIQNK